MSESKIESFNFKLAFRRNEIIGKWESAIAIAIELGVGKNQVTQILKRNAKILEDAENRFAGDQVRQRGY